MRRIFRVMTGCDANVPRDVVIAAMTWERVDEPVKAPIVSCRGDLIMATFRSDSEQLTSKMMRITGMRGKAKPMKKSFSLPQDAVPWHTFNRSEILKFVDDVHDENPIHRTEQAIVPGCLLLEELAKRLNDANDNQRLKRLDIRFHHPCFNDEPVYLADHGHRIEGYSAHKPLFTLRWTALAD